MKTLFSNQKGAYFFVIDVLIGMFIFIVTIFLIFGYTSFQPSLGGAKQTLDIAEQKFFALPLSKVDSGNAFLAILKNSHPDYKSTYTVDEFVYLLYNKSDMVNASLLIGNLTEWIPANMGFNYSINGQEIYSRQAISKSMDQSSVKLAQKKITLLSPNITTQYDLAITEVVVWQ